MATSILIQTFYEISDQKQNMPKALCLFNAKKNCSEIKWCGPMRLLLEDRKGGPSVRLRVLVQRSALYSGDLW